MSIFDSFSESEIQTENALATIVDTALKKRIDAITACYEELLGIRVRSHFTKETDTAQEMLHDKKISAEDITYFCHTLSPYQRHPSFERTGLFLNALVQHAYNQGENNFVVPLPFEKPLPYVAHELSGKKAHDLHVRYIGECGIVSAQGASCCHITVDGNTNEIGRGAQQSTFAINGTAGDFVGQMAEYCIFVAESDIGALFGANATHCTFIARQNVGQDFMRESHYCIGEVYGDAGDFFAMDTRNSVVQAHGTVGKFAGKGSRSTTFQSPHEEVLDEIYKWSSNGCYYERI